jgi:hypothetical protein
VDNARDDDSAFRDFERKKPAESFSPMGSKQLFAWHGPAGNLSNTRHRT